MEGDVRVCSDVVFPDFWCGFAVLARFVVLQFYKTRQFVVLRNFRVISMWFAVFSYVILCNVYRYICAVLRYSYPPYAPLLM